MVQVNLQPNPTQPLACLGLVQFDLRTNSTFGPTHAGPTQLLTWPTLAWSLARLDLARPSTCVDPTRLSIWISPAWPSAQLDFARPLVQVRSTSSTFGLTWVGPACPLARLCSTFEPTRFDFLSNPTQIFGLVNFFFPN